ncbi:MAG: 30S ribosomal protein S19 [Nanoarchaeota archaeon]|nr:30S ribosomal protein S19 [Nanoarchaeota archaeon]
MAKKEFTYRGKNKEDLAKIDFKDFLNLLPTRQRRSLKRGFSEPQKKLLNQIKRFKEGKRKKPVRTHCRNMIIIPDFLGLTIYIYNGKTFSPVTIIPEMLGHYLGEFALTRSKVAHNQPGVGATRSSSAVSVK